MRRKKTLFNTAQAACCWRAKARARTADLPAVHELPSRSALVGMGAALGGEKEEEEKAVEEGRGQQTERELVPALLLDIGEEEEEGWGGGGGGGSGGRCRAKDVGRMLQRPCLQRPCRSRWQGRRVGRRWCLVSLVARIRQP